MESTEEKKMRLKQKASFYFKEKIICHVTKEPKGFANGWFRSDLIEDWYYWFEDSRWPGEERRLFLADIFDVEDYEEENKNASS